jgi:hypothetical protein
MLRLISLLAVGAALAVALLIPGSASAVVVNACPHSFVLLPDSDFMRPSGEPVDRNGDELVCGNVNAEKFHLVLIDNNVPDPIAEGVTDTGSSVLVDTATGEVLGV